MRQLVTYKKINKQKEFRKSYKEEDKYYDKIIPSFLSNCVID